MPVVFRLVIKIMDKGLRRDFKQLREVLGITRLRWATISTDLDKSVSFALVSLVVLYAYFLTRFLSGYADRFDAMNYEIGHDFIAFWGASRLVGTIPIDQLIDVKGFTEALTRLAGKPIEVIAWSYPPNALLLFLPFSFFSYLVGLALFQISTFLIFVRSLAAAFPAKGVIIIFVLAVLAPSSVLNIFSGQSSFLAAALLTGALACFEKRPLLAALLIGLAAFKPQLGILIPVAFAASGAWQCFLLSALTVAGLVLASVALYGIDIWIAYLTTVPDRTFEIFTETGSGLFIEMTVSPFMAMVRHLELGIPAGIALQGLLILFSIVAVFWVYRQPVQQHLKLAVWSFATALATPYMHIYDLTIVLPGIFSLYIVSHQRPSAVAYRYASGLVYLLPLFIIPLNTYGWPPTSLFLLIALIMILAEVRRETRYQEVKPSRSN